MKGFLVVTLLLISFATVASTEGRGPIPTTTKPPQVGAILLADGPGPIPTTNKPPQGNIVA